MPRVCYFSCFIKTKKPRFCSRGKKIYLPHELTNLCYSRIPLTNSTYSRIPLTN